MFTFPCVMIRPQKFCKNIFSMARKGPLLLKEWLRSTRFLCFYPLAIDKSVWEENCYIIKTEIPERKVREFDPPISIQIQRHDSLKFIIDSTHELQSLTRARWLTSGMAEAEREGEIVSMGTESGISKYFLRNTANKTPR